MVDAARTGIVVPASAGFRLPAACPGQKFRMGRARDPRGATGRFREVGCRFHVFFVFWLRLKAARTAVCSHDQEQGAKLPFVSIHEAPGQMVQKAMSAHVAQRGEKSLKRNARRRRRGADFRQMAASGISRTFPQTRGKELQGVTLPVGETHKVVRPAWQTGPFARASRACSAPAKGSGVEFRSRNASYSEGRSIIGFRPVPEWPGTRMLAGFTGNPVFSPSSIAEKTSSR